MAALRSGDVRRAIELMLDTYQDEVYGYCARLVGRRDAPAIYRRVLASAITDLSAVDDTSPFDDVDPVTSTRSLRAWLYQIARRTVAHHHRADQRGYPGSLDPDYVPVSGPDDAPGRRLQDEATQRSLESLDPEMREILQLVYWHGLRLREVAQVVEVDLATVRRAVAAGLVAFTVLDNADDCAPS